MLVQQGSTHYTQDLVAPLSQILGDGTNTYIYGRERLYGQTGGTRTWYATDALGSVRHTLTNAGAFGAGQSFDPWGVPQTILVTPFGFTGELQDAQGLTYLRARWYAATEGRFGSRDPFAGYDQQPYSLNPYQYASSNPVRNTDPTGMCSQQGDNYCLPSQWNGTESWKGNITCEFGKFNECLVEAYVRIEVEDPIASFYLPFFEFLDDHASEAWYYTPVTDPEIRGLLSKYGYFHVDGTLTDIETKLWAWKQQWYSSSFGNTCSDFLFHAMDGLGGGIGAAAAAAAFENMNSGGGSGVTYNTSPNKYSARQGAYYASASITPDGVLDLNFKTKINGVHGSIVAKDEFGAIIKHFGPERIQVIRGTWSATEGLDDNLRMFNEASKRMSLDDAAFETWTGGQAKIYGYTKVKSILALPKENVGEFTDVIVEFTH